MYSALLLADFHYWVKFCTCSVLHTCTTFASVRNYNVHYHCTVLVPCVVNRTFAPGVTAVRHQCLVACFSVVHVVHVWSVTHMTACTSLRAYSLDEMCFGRRHLLYGESADFENVLMSAFKRFRNWMRTSIFRQPIRRTA